jgi:F-type H+-transporting ATPase subunit delta
LAQEDSHVSGVAGRYASALFTSAQEERQSEAVSNALAKLDAMIVGSPDLRSLVRSPVFSEIEQTKAMDAILASAGIDGLAANFVRLVGRKRRLFWLREMIADYRKLYEEARGVTRAEVVTATPLSADNVTALKEQLKASSGGREIVLDTKVDPSIVGGLIVRLGSRMVDASLRTKLNAIRLAMKEVG